mgnify:CR=1 FL=1
MQWGITQYNHKSTIVSKEAKQTGNAARKAGVPHARGDLFEDEVGGDLKENVANVKDADRHTVLDGGEAKRLLKILLHIT